MKYAGLLVMPAGFFLAAAALVLFPDAGLRGTFVVCGLAVELLGWASPCAGTWSGVPEPNPARASRSGRR